MEFLQHPHPRGVKTLINLLLTLFICCGAVSAQKTVYLPASDLVYDYYTKKIKVRATDKVFTGVEYSINYYSKDTTQLRKFYNGKEEWSKYYGSGKVLTNYQVFYLHGLKNDSICMERIAYFPNGKDTNYYEVQYLTKDKKKLYIQKQYQQYYDAKGKIRPYLYSVRTMRFFHKRDVQYFTEQQFKDANAFDSAGYHTTYADYGIYREYHSDGKIRTQGTFNSFDYRVRNRGAYPAYPFYGKTGTWTYYRQDGVKEREEFYREGKTTIGIVYYYASGKVQSQMNYECEFGELKFPVKEGFNVRKKDTCIVQQATWTESGVMTNQIVRLPAGDVVSSYYYSNGTPATFGTTASGGKPVGIHKQWDEKGRVKQFLNFSVESNDTLCYVAVDGKLHKLNLRNRNESMSWDKVVYSYNYNSSYTHLYSLSTQYKEFYSNGRQKSQAEMRNGKRHGAYVEWDSTGMLILQASFRNDLADGQWAEWHSNGKPKKMYMYKDGLRSGVCSEYYRTGALKWENTYSLGSPGTGKAYSENGTLLKQTLYTEAFYPSSCLKEQKDAAAGISMYFFLQDTAVSGSYMTFSDTIIKKYADKVMVLRTAHVYGGDYCALPQKNKADTKGEFDVFHSRFVISETLNTPSNKIKMKNFFARHKITMSEPKISDSPVLGLEKEYTIDYSSTAILNKKAIIDSLETLLIRNANDIKQGYIMSVDMNLPSGNLSENGGSVQMNTFEGYSTVTITNKEVNHMTYVPLTKTVTYIIYDDLTCDLRNVSFSSENLYYWALNPR